MILNLTADEVKRVIDSLEIRTRAFLQFSQSTPPYPHPDFLSQRRNAGKKAQDCNDLKEKIVTQLKQEGGKSSEIEKPIKMLDDQV